MTNTWGHRKLSAPTGGSDLSTCRAPATDVNSSAAALCAKTESWGSVRDRRCNV